MQIGVDRKLGTAMKSVGEVMAIGRTFEEAFQKSLRMIDIGVAGFEPGFHEASDAELENPSDYRFLVLATALTEGYSIERLYESVPLSQSRCTPVHLLISSADVRMHA
jgi:hypothetical protein